MRSMSFLPSKRLVASYVLDWIVIIAIAAIGAAFNAPMPYMRPFSLVDLSISYPLVESKIPTWLLLVISLLAPLLIIFVVCLVFVPGPTVTPNTPKSLIWRRKFWEWNTGWMGLCLSMALAFFFTQGMKNLFGKPRPDMLARCRPDTSLESISRNMVGQGYGAQFDPRWVLVGAGICNPTSMSDFKDGFRSFPSGHASMSWSGLLYLAFFLCSKFAISIPFLSPRAFSQDQAATAAEDPYREDSDTLPLHHDRGTPSTIGSKNLSRADPDTNIVPIRNQAAAPPNVLLILPMLPICVAIYICASRFFQFYHHGFDVISGSLIGILSSWFAFRWYHLPIRQGAGWSWGARSRDRAFGVGLGRATYVGPEGWGSKKSDERTANNRVNGGNTILGPGYDGPSESVPEHGRENVGTAV